MNNLLVFFALPVATVILAIVLQKVLRNPLLVAATFFAIYLVVTFAFFDASFLVFAILYTILAYVTAVLTRWICRLIRILADRNNCDDECNNTRGIATINNTIPVNNSIPFNNENLVNDTIYLTANNSQNKTHKNCNHTYGYARR